MDPENMEKLVKDAELMNKSRLSSQELSILLKDFLDVLGTNSDSLFIKTSVMLYHARKMKQV